MGNAISIADRKPENYAKDLTLRYPIHPVFDGDKLKITLDNFCGTQPVTISEVYIAVMWQKAAERLNRDGEGCDF